MAKTKTKPPVKKKTPRKPYTRNPRQFKHKPLSQLKTIEDLQAEDDRLAREDLRLAEVERDYITSHLWEYCRAEILQCLRAE